MDLLNHTNKIVLTLFSSNKFINVKCILPYIKYILGAFKSALSLPVFILLSDITSLLVIIHPWVCTNFKSNCYQSQGPLSFSFSALYY